MLQVSLTTTHRNVSRGSPSPDELEGVVALLDLLPRWLKGRVANLAVLHRLHSGVGPSLTYVIVVCCVLICCSSCCVFWCLTERSTFERLETAKASKSTTSATTVPVRQSSLWPRPALNVLAVPPPRALAQMPLPVTMSLPSLSKPRERSKLNGILSVCVDELPADVTSVGGFQVVRIDDAGQEVALYAMVRMIKGFRELLLAVAPTFDRVLARCCPVHSSSYVHNDPCLTPCNSLDILDRDGKHWGTIIPLGSDSYSVIRGNKQVLAIEGIQEVGRLAIAVRLNDHTEPAAHAERVQAPGPVRLEMGVRPQLDPLLALACILGVVIFNPEERSPTPLLSVGECWS